MLVEEHVGILSKHLLKGYFGYPFVIHVVPIPIFFPCICNIVSSLYGSHVDTHCCELVYWIFVEREILPFFIYKRTHVEVLFKGKRISYLSHWVRLKPNELENKELG